MRFVARNESGMSSGNEPEGERSLMDSMKGASASLAAAFFSLPFWASSPTSSPGIHPCWPVNCHSVAMPPWVSESKVKYQYRVRPKGKLYTST